MKLGGADNQGDKHLSANLPAVAIVVRVAVVVLRVDRYTLSVVSNVQSVVDATRVRSAVGVVLDGDLAGRRAVVWVACASHPYNGAFTC